MENEVQYFIVSCSGASNTGKYADEVARQLSANGVAKMVCLPKIAVGDQALVQEIKTKNMNIVVLDGCPVNCAEKLLRKEGITENIIHINTTDFGIVKGKTPYSAEKAKEIIEYIKQVTSK